MNAPRSQAPHRRRRCAVLAGLAACLGTALPAQAQAQPAYPTRPVTLVVPYPPGGSADTVGRLVGQRLSEELGQPVLIDNRPGAGTAVGAAFVAKASPDGYTLLLGSGSTLTMNPAIRRTCLTTPWAASSRSRSSRAFR